ncbi:MULTISPECIES: [citrate (pro-3S)-lyase] ligase [Vibrio]|uniref:[Citrate [pro-3S]-lyase] ligase n=1 Tax=Vibrio diazotrophicus TaxID=685 RepID=A0A2J8I478_VIBDI|nr:[citrate (pro-3S)-lyase] ligase [Vibrio diazotrophicus]MCF7360647.1 [citrate (pro-3S)-lyase] ligase [Vibrio sp. A1-b2]PNH96553.1 [citrate (pro-3S)-lyase] ligase [Vibrio diazotrophicus]PNI02339.1 [citrate (pro-3S)-lyase] ligase [Vibrio diazotrophicus]PNI05338.1 [citrate (pro-3S)-lyase] ligase [Vibrio diazotrophicus]
MFDTYQFQKINTQNSSQMEKVRQFLLSMGLGIDADVEFFVIALNSNAIVGCAGLAGNTLKSIAVSPNFQGTGLSTQLLTEVVTHAYDMGRYNLFIYTKPDNYRMFHDAGFHQLTAVKDRVVLLENSKTRLQEHCEKLSSFAQPGEKIGSIVMNANPFTNGHRYLVQHASENCDWVHLFVVKEDRSFFSYLDRLNMIKAGVKEFNNVTVHAGSDYIISRATFPSYFLKDEGVINYCHTAVDLQIFRQYIAPALGITHRYVGTEPICKVTRFYNQQMHQWLSTPTIDSPKVTYVEIPRCEEEESPISASLVRKYLFENNWQAIEKIVPETTYAYLHQLFIEDTSAYHAKRKQAALRTAQAEQLSLS